MQIWKVIVYWLKSSWLKFKHSFSLIPKDLTYTLNQILEISQVYPKMALLHFKPLPYMFYYPDLPTKRGDPHLQLRDGVKTSQHHLTCIPRIITALWILLLLWCIPLAIILHFIYTNHAFLFLMLYKCWYNCFFFSSHLSILSFSSLRNPQVFRLNTLKIQKVSIWYVYFLIWMHYRSCNSIINTVGNTRIWWVIKWL